MNLEQQVCSLELAKKLSDLGVEQRDSLFYWIGDSEDKMFLGRASDTLKIEGDPFNGMEQVPYKYDYSAFTVAELGEMLPKGASSFRIDKWGCSCYETPLNQVADAEADARAKMLIYLLENKLI